MHTAFKQRQQLGYERFEENRRFEEKTDIAERLGYPIDVTINYELHGQAVYAITDTVERPFHQQTLQAKLAGFTKFTGDQAFEQERLAHEHDEALMVDKLAADELDGNVLIKFSKVPDAVVENRTSIKGYRRDLLRSFVRVYYTTDTGVGCRLFTLDHNHPEGLERVGSLLAIDATRPSEEVLADHALIMVPGDANVFVEGLVAEAKATYDQAVQQKTGLVTHAGSLYANKRDAMQAIEMQPNLIREHLSAITTIVGDTQREQARERIAAAIKLAVEGHHVASISDASVTVEVSTSNYGGECAASPTGMNQANLAPSKENVWSHGECQVCFAKTMVGSCMVCRACAAADARGADLLKLRDRNLRRRTKINQISQFAVDQTHSKRLPSRAGKPKLDMITARYGEHAAVKNMIVFGGAKQIIYDRRTEEVLAG